MNDRRSPTCGIGSSLAWVYWDPAKEIKSGTRKMPCRLRRVQSTVGWASALLNVLMDQAIPNYHFILIVATRWIVQFLLLCIK